MVACRPFAKGKDPRGILRAGGERKEDRERLLADHRIADALDPQKPSPAYGRIERATWPVAHRVVSDSSGHLSARASRPSRRRPGARERH